MSKTGQFTMVTSPWLPEQHPQGTDTSELTNGAFGVWQCQPQYSASGCI